MGSIILAKAEPFTPVLIIILTLSIITLGLPVLNKFISKESKKAFAGQVDHVLLKYSYHGFIDLFKSHADKKGTVFLVSFWFSAILVYFFFNLIVAICLVGNGNPEIRQNCLYHYSTLFACGLWSVVIDGHKPKKFSWKKLLKFRVILSILFQFLLLMIGMVLLYSIITYYLMGDFYYSQSFINNRENNLLSEFFQLIAIEEPQSYYIFFAALFLYMVLITIFSMLAYPGAYVILSFYTFIQYSVRKRLAKLGFVVSENDPYYLDTIISVAIALLMAITLILTYRYGYY